MFRPDGPGPIVGSSPDTAGRSSNKPWPPGSTPPHGRLHTRIAIALGLGWPVDAFECRSSARIPGIQQEFGRDSGYAVSINAVWFASVPVGALGFGFPADRVGPKRLFATTLNPYSIAAVATARAPGYRWLIACRSVTALGFGREHPAVKIAQFTRPTTAAVASVWS